MMNGQPGTAPAAPLCTSDALGDGGVFGGCRRDTPSGTVTDERAFRTARRFGMTKRSDALGRPAPNEDKDQNVEQAKARGSRALPPAAPASPPKEAERVDPTERTRAGERR